MFPVNSLQKLKPFKTFSQITNLQTQFLLCFQIYVQYIYIFSFLNFAFLGGDKLQKCVVVFLHKNGVWLGSTLIAYSNIESK